MWVRHISFQCTPKYPHTLLWYNSIQQLVLCPLTATVPSVMLVYLVVRSLFCLFVDFVFPLNSWNFVIQKKKVLCRHRQLQRIALAGEVICILYLCFYDFITGNPRYTFDCSSSFADRLREQGKLFECGVDNLCIDASKDVCDSTVNCDNFIDESDCDDEWLGRCYYYNIRHAAIWNPYRNHEHGFKCSQWTDTCIRTTIGYKYYIVGLHLCHTYLFTF